MVSSPGRGQHWGIHRRRRLVHRNGDPIAAGTRPATTSPPQIFRFLDLPAEIRNQIYGLLLKARPVKRCGRWFPHVWSYNFGLSTEILRTCQFVKCEGEYILRQNDFVKFIIRVNDFEKAWFSHREVQHLELDLEEPFEAFVLSHEITAPQFVTVQYLPRVYILFHDDLDIFLSAISECELKLEDHRLLMRHIVTLPQFPSASTSSTSDSIRRSQEKLIAPLRAELHNLPHFELQGAISKDVKLAAEMDVSFPPPTDHWDVLERVDELNRLGDAFFHTGRGNVRDKNGAASEYWAEAAEMIERVMSDEGYRSLRENGGPKFLKTLKQIAFYSESSKSRDYLQGIMDRKAIDIDTLDTKILYWEKVCDAVSAAALISHKYPESVWRPKPAELAENLYTQAVACRYIGGPMMLRLAEKVLEEALELKPKEWKFTWEMGGIRDLRRPYHKLDELPTHQKAYKALIAKVAARQKAAVSELKGKARLGRDDVIGLLAKTRITRFAEA